VFISHRGWFPATRSNSATRVSMSSSSIALAEWSSTLSAARAFVDGGVVGSIMSLCRDRRTRSLLKTCDGLSKCGPARLPARSIEIRVFQPAEERGRANADRAGSLLDVLLGEECDDRLFLLAFIFRAVALHLKLPAITGVIAFPSPFPFCHRIRLLLFPTRVIDVLTR
jgi:hypothetical protein